MSSLWTPEGEHRVGPDRPGAGPATGTTPVSDAPGDDLGMDAEELADEEAVAARMAELRGQLVATPVEIVVANHAYGLFELAAMHLSEQPAHFEQARLAIDALGTLVEGLAGRLGEAEPSLIDALAQLRLAYVQLQGASDASPGADDGPGA